MFGSEPLPPPQHIRITTHTVVTSELHVGQLAFRPRKAPLAIQALQGDLQKKTVNMLSMYGRGENNVSKIVKNAGLTFL